MKNVMKLFDDIKSTSSRLDKERILKENEDNKIFISVLKFLFNDRIVTGISAKKIKKDLGSYDIPDDIRIPTTIQELFKYLERNNTGRDLDIAVINKSISELDKDMQEFIKGVITKSHKLGVTASTMNKVYGKDFILLFNPMLAHPYDKYESKVEGDFYITLKLDGIRCIVKNEEDGVKFYTRKGIPVEGMKDLAREFESMPKGWAFDGELLAVNKDNLSSKDLFRATQTIVRKDGTKKGVEFYIFDILPIKEFEAGKSKNTYEIRRNQLNLLESRMSSANPVELIKVLPVLYKGSEKGSVVGLMKWAEDNGYEGLMLNLKDGKYLGKRSQDLLKIKSFKTADLLCIGLEEGAGKNKGKLGAVLLVYEGGVTKAGTGFSDAERVHFWENPDDIVGKVVEISFFEESQNQNGGRSLRFPVFKTVRDDKSSEDVNID